MHAVILAGGKGVRLRPYTTCLPKPLVPLGDEFSILEVVIRQLRAHGFTHATIAIGHLGHLIRAYVGDGSQWGMQIDYATEESPLGTIGPVLQILDRLPDNILVMNGDVLTDLSYADLMAYHKHAGAELTVATYNRDAKIDFGVLDTDGGRIVGFREKPVFNYSVSMGVYAIRTEALRRHTVGQPLGFDDLVLDMLGRQVHPCSYPFDGFWLDIGRPDDYDRANEEFATLRRLLLPQEYVVDLTEKPALESVPPVRPRRRTGATAKAPAAKQRVVARAG